MYAQPAHQPFHPLNYKLLAESIKTRRKHEEANLKMLKQGEQKPAVAAESARL
jgi:hypothetical protein